MKYIAAFILLASAPAGFAQVAEVGDVIVLRGETEICGKRFFRVLDLVQAETSTPIGIYSLPGIQVVGLSPIQIAARIQAELNKRDDLVPMSLEVELVNDPSRYLEVVEEYEAGLRFLSRSCENKKRGWRLDWQPPPDLDPEMRRIYRTAYLDLVALAPVSRSSIVR